MSKPTTDLPDCTEKCKSSQHGDIITAAISKRSISDTDLCSYLNYTCFCCDSIRDSVGRTALHVAASCGRTDLARWLVQNRRANMNVKDSESGYTPLHRSMFYGKLATTVELMKLGANPSTLDSNSLTFLEHAMCDNYVPESTNLGGELYVWGSNTNNSLGPQQARSTPEILDVFHKDNPNEYVQQICLAKFHSLILTDSGKAFSCGHGQGGRLGLGVQQTVMTPKEIEFPDTHQSEPLTCTQASISKDHSLFLMSDGNIYSCGLNVHRVLGLDPPPQQSLVPRQLKHIAIEVKGVCTGAYHSVAWGQTGLYTWGLNAGQLGHKINTKNGDKYVTSPKFVKSISLGETNIKCVSVSDGATAVCTEKGDIYVLHEYQCRKIASRQLNAVEVSIIGGKLNSSLDPELSKSYPELKVIVLTNTGNLLLWQESDPQPCRCIFSINRAVIIKQVTLNLNEVLFVTQYGEAYKGVFTPRKKRPLSSEKDKNSEKSAFHKFLEKEECIIVKLHKFPRIHRAVHIQSDPKGNDYSVIQALPYRYFSFPDIVDSEMHTQFKTLLEEVDLMDNIHDITFKIGNKLFPAHSFIVASKSSYLRKQILQNEKETVNLPGVHPEIFEQFLKFVYTGSCELIQCGELKNIHLRNICEQTKKGGEEDIIDPDIDTKMSAFEYYQNGKTENDCNKNNSRESTFRNPVRMLHEMAKRYAVSDLQNILSNLDMQKYTVIKKKATKEFKAKVLKFDRTAFSEFYDVTIACRDNKKIEAHKCVLAARLEYFNSMFSVRWKGSETSEISLPFPKSIAEALLEFLYTDTLSLLNNKDIEHLFKVLILADQLFVTRLKEQCEFLLTNSLTLKNAVQLLSFAHIYNAKKLKQCCMKFITSNIAPFLEVQALDELDELLLRELSDCYFEEKPALWCRVITPYSTAVSDEEIVRISSMFPVDFNEKIEKEKTTKASQKRRPRIHRNSSEKNTSISIENDVSVDSIIQFPDIQEITKPESDLSDWNVAQRLKAINLARDKVSSEGLEYNFEKLSSSRNSDIELDLSSSFNDSFQFPELNSPPNANSFHHKTPLKPAESKHKIVKLSQKQRKRLSSESGSAAPSTPVAESPKNPWKIIPINHPSPSTSLNTDYTMGSIISDEKRQKGNLAKLTSKLLIYTQIEDKAIVELHKFYNTENLPDEIITIERVAIGAIASPVWVPKNNR